MTRRMGLGVILRMACRSSWPSAGEPSASITTTASSVMTNPALELNASLAALATPGLPCTYQARAVTLMGVTGDLTGG